MHLGANGAVIPDLHFANLRVDAWSRWSLRPRHMTMTDYVLYLKEYSAHFGLLELIRFNVKVGARLCSAWMKWRMSQVINVQKGCNTMDSYDVSLERRMHLIHLNKFARSLSNCHRTREFLALWRSFTFSQKTRIPSLKNSIFSHVFVFLADHESHARASRHHSTVDATEHSPAAPPRFATQQDAAGWWRWLSSICRGWWGHETA